MPRRKARATVADEVSRPAAKNEVVHEVAALLASIDSLSQSWPKGPDGQPVRLGDASMPMDVADASDRLSNRPAAASPKLPFYLASTP
jgi:hypothetical protein